MEDGKNSFKSHQSHFQVKHKICRFARHISAVICDPANNPLVISSKRYFTNLKNKSKHFPKFPLNTCLIDAMPVKGGARSQIYKISQQSSASDERISRWCSHKQDVLSREPVELWEAEAGSHLECKLCCCLLPGKRLLWMEWWSQKFHCLLRNLLELVHQLSCLRPAKSISRRSMNQTKINELRIKELKN